MVGQTSVVAQPLTRFMNHLSLVESIRVRVRQDLLGLERLEGSKCPFHVEEPKETLQSGPQERLERSRRWRWARAWAGKKHCQRN